MASYFGNFMDNMLPESMFTCRVNSEVLVHIAYHLYHYSITYVLDF